MTTTSLITQMNQVLNCPICGGQGSIIDTVRTINKESPNLVELRACSMCAHWWHNPVPDQTTLSALYKTVSPYVFGPGAEVSYTSVKAENSEQSFHRFIYKSLSASCEQPRYLEIGTGGGDLMRSFRKLGYECFGVDPGQWTREANVFPRLEDLPGDLLFDFFVLQDVLEHVVDPVAMLGKLRLIAGNRASIYASFPCNESRQARRYRGAWNMVLPYGHLHYFSFESAKRLFHSTGWSVCECVLSRRQPLTQHFRQFNLRALAYELLKGGSDQLYVHASS